MRVTATRRGFYVKLRNPGDQFDIRDDAFSPKWMKRVAEPTAEAPASLPDAPVVVPPEEPPVVEPVVKKRRGRKPKAVSE